jgi:hypothetical protein
MITYQKIYLIYDDYDTQINTCQAGSNKMLTFYWTAAKGVILCAVQAMQHNTVKKSNILKYAYHGVH